MSTAQDSTQQYQQYGDAGSRFHARHGSASSILAATTFGMGYNPLATPSNVSAYGSVSWPGSHNVSPSIWSQNHQGRAQWPCSGAYQDRQAGNYYNGSYAGYTYVPRQYPSHVYGTQQPMQQQIGQQSLRPSHEPQMLMVPQVAPVSQVPQVPQVAQVPSVSQIPSVPAVPQVAQVPQIQPAAQLHQQVSAPLMASYLPAAPLPQNAAQVQFQMRAPLQPYQSIASPGSVAQNTEYDVQAFSRFFVAVATGIFVADLTASERTSLEQFVSTLLTATRLPKSTVLMSFVFLNQWHKLNSDELRNMTLKTQVLCSLVLANKMNDDNTFTNTSWGVVSGVPAQQITKLEHVWLDALDWRLNLDENGIAEWNYWKKCWTQYEQSTPSPSMHSPLPLQGIWAPSGFVYEPFSVAVC